MLLVSGDILIHKLAHTGSECATFVSQYTTRDQRVTSLAVGLVPSKSLAHACLCAPLNAIPPQGNCDTVGATPASIAWASCLGNQPRCKILALFTKTKLDRSIEDVIDGFG